MLDTAYKIFPDSKAAKGEDDNADSSDGDGSGGGEMSSEAIAMAYLMRGVHF